MFEEYSQHNLHLAGINHFLESDPQLLILKGLKYVHPLDWWHEIDWERPGIYLLTGGRQVGKSTSTKLLIKDLLMTKRFLPQEIFYLPCDQIEHHRELAQIIRSFFSSLAREKNRFLLVIDEVTYVKEWDRAIKALADEGWFRTGFCVVTGSDSMILKEAMNRFPGRRGEADKTDFHLRPLGFREYRDLVQQTPGEAFESYLRCGGHLRAVNDFHQHGEVRQATYAVFEQWIRGDFEKRGKSSRHLMGILKMIVETLGSQVTYSHLAHRMGEITLPTFLDYCDHLERLDLLFSLQAFDQNRQIGFPKKAHKLHFWDPFILDTVQKWLAREGFLSQTIDDSLKAESIVAAHFKSRVPTYYFKAKGEVDVVAVEKGRVRFVEVKWTSQLRPWNIAELKKQKDAVLLTKQPAGGNIEGIPVLFLPSFLVTPHAIQGEGGGTSNTALFP